MDTLANRATSAVVGRAALLVLNGIAFLARACLMVARDHRGRHDRRDPGDGLIVVARSPAGFGGNAVAPGAHVLHTNRFTVQQRSTRPARAGACR
ncbi:hypothetical protein MPRM_38060 [Mycobacterium parmense]|uniref:Uncharacterized protein n=1 Tax=Mycobacterium parmense TaxID=185642 RepID=A0A7I7YX97_9MYCO|nr:hypothetical protein MPRM_38060 [Mycobacterium parmense]